MGLPERNTTTVYYQYLILIGGKAVGTIQRFSPSSERSLERIRQIMGGIDDVVEIAPGRTDTQLTVDRLELNTSAIIDLLAPDEGFIDIGQIMQPITIVEIKKTRTGDVRLEYQDCWIKSYTKTISVDTISVTESVTLWPTRITKGD